MNRFVAFILLSLAACSHTEVRESRRARAWIYDPQAITLEEEAVIPPAPSEPLPQNPLIVPLTNTVSVTEEAGYCLMVVELTPPSDGVWTIAAGQSFYLQLQIPENAMDEFFIGIARAGSAELLTPVPFPIEAPRAGERIFVNLPFTENHTLAGGSTATFYVVFIPMRLREPCEVTTTLLCVEVQQRTDVGVY